MNTGPVRGLRLLTQCDDAAVPDDPTVGHGIQLLGGEEAALVEHWPEQRHLCTAVRIRAYSAVRTRFCIERVLGARPGFWFRL